MTGKAMTRRDWMRYLGLGAVALTPACIGRARRTRRRGRRRGRRRERRNEAPPRVEQSF